MSNIYMLGPQGTFSSMAGALLSELYKLKTVVTKSIPEVFVRIENEKDSLGVVPIENMSLGVIGLTQEYLQIHKIEIIAEMRMLIQFALIHKKGTDITLNSRLFAFEVSQNQCSEHIYKKCNFKEIEDTRSNIDSYEQLEEKGLPGDAAIVPLPFCDSKIRERYVVTENIQNDPDNFTRFLVLKNGLENSELDYSKPKATIYIDSKHDRPSLLYNILEKFHRNEINLTLLHSTPSKKYKGDYGFLIDFQNKSPEATIKCLNEIKKLDVDLNLLGFYGPIIFPDK